jgi:hypothetical protein
MKDTLENDLVSYHKHMDQKYPISSIDSIKFMEKLSENSYVIRVPIVKSDTHSALVARIEEYLKAKYQIYAAIMNHPTFTEIYIRKPDR